MVPSLLRSILFCLSISGGDRRLPRLRLWLSNSETLQPNLLAKFFEMFPDDRRFANLYGSSETMADVTYELFSSAEDAHAKRYDGKLSIGRPMANCNVYVLGKDLDTVPLGEVCISEYTFAINCARTCAYMHTFITTCQTHMFPLPDCNEDITLSLVPIYLHIHAAV